jgi:predicted nucleic acid-binding protein
LLQGGFPACQGLFFVAGRGLSPAYVSNGAKVNEESVVLDTNVFVAAGFNPDSDSAQIIKAIEEGHLRMVWHEDTRRETRCILEQIPPLSWTDFAGLFRDSDRDQASLQTDRFDFIPDPADRKFIALAEAAQAVLISNDDHLLEHRGETQVSILAPAEFQQRRG